MDEPIVVDHPTFWPHRCVQCNSATGPLVDTSVELPGGAGRVYLCASCVRIDGIKLGLIRGKRNQELLQAAKAESAMRDEVEKQQQRAAGLEAELVSAREQADAQAELVAWQQQRIGQLEAAIGDRAASLASLVES